jgi:AcrR family transcriptional regulator
VIAKQAPQNDAIGASKPVARRPGGRSARIRRAVFDSTLALLAANGYQSLTIEAVAAAAGVNKSTVYRNWPTKAALLRAAAEDRSEATIAIDTTGDPEQDLAAFLSSVADNITSPIGQALLIAAMSEMNDIEVLHQRSGFWKHRFQAAGDLIRSAAKDGQSAGDLDVDAVIEHLIGPVHLRALITGTPIDRDFIEKTVDATIHLISCGAIHRD